MFRNLCRATRYHFYVKIDKPFRPISSTLLVKYDCITKLNNVYTTEQRYHSVNLSSGNEEISAAKFDSVCSDTLESLCEYFEEIIESSLDQKSADVTYNDGVLTIHFAKPHGTYVINRQTPNKQIWLSSPTSGPKRYDFYSHNGGYWVYKHDGVTLHQLLQQEISKILPQQKIDFSKCSYSYV